MRRAKASPAVLPVFGFALLGALLLGACSPRSSDASLPGAPRGEARAGAPGRPAPSSTKPVFLPARFLPGDEVTAFLPLAAAGDRPATALELKPGSGLPSSGPLADPVLRSLRIERVGEDWQARVVFVPWSPGPGLIPSISARGFVLPPISYNVSSVLGAEDRDLAPPRAQREPPGTAVYLYGFAGLVLALALGTLGSAAYLVPAARSLLRRWKAAQAFRRLRRSVGFLCRGLETAAPELFYAALARELRIYLAARVEPGIPNLTATELALLPESLFPAPGLRDGLASLIAETERGRYSGELASGPETALLLRGAADRVLALGESAEEAIDARL